MLFFCACNQQQDKRGDLSKDDARLEIFGKDSILILDSLYAVYQYDSIRFYWNGYHNYYTKLPDSVMPSYQYDHAGSAAFQSEDKKISLGTFACFNLAECSKYEMYKDDILKYEQEGYTLSLKAFQDSVFLFAGQLDSMMFYEKIVYYNNNDESDTEILSVIKLKYPVSKQEEANKIIKETISQFPDKPF